MQTQRTHSSAHDSQSYYWDILFVSIVIGSLFFLFLGSRPLFVPDEGRYAEIAREMIANSDYITPTLNNIIYFEKPALFYWLVAASYKLAGISIWSARAVNALLGLFGCIMTYCTARILYNRLTGLLAALIQSTCLLYFIMAHMVSLDLPVTVFLSATLYSFLLGNQLKQYRYFYLAALCAALAVLTKGLIGIVFPGLIIGAYTLLTHQWKQIKHWCLPSALLLFLIVVTPWHILVQLKHPQFLHFYFIEQHFLRYTDQSIGHYEPIWFFIPYLLLGLLPWVIFLPQTLFTTIRDKKNNINTFFFLWATIVFLFFSFSKSKLIPYILPIFPALSILIANYVANTRFPHKTNNTDSPMTLLGHSKFICAIISISWFALVGLMAYAPKLDTRTIAPLAAILKPIIKSDDIIVTYNQYYQDLPFYLERQVHILNWKNELSFGMQLQDTSDWMINDARLWQLWNSKKRVFIVISAPEWQHLQQIHPDMTFNVLGRTQTNLLVSNQKTR